MSEHLCGLCEIGSYEGMIELVAPSWSSKKTICVDICLAMEITNLWKVGIRTTGCCCGHGKALGYIGVWEEDIERMLDLGYEVRPNETDTSRRDGFYPKTKFNTRSVPDVPELVRYAYDRSSSTFWSDDTGERAMDGEYVLHSQATEIIAVKDKEIEEALKQRNMTIDNVGRLLKDLASMTERAEAAEAKLNAKDEEIELWVKEAKTHKKSKDEFEEELKHLKSAYEAVVEAGLSNETKLAQIKAQEPVGYIIKHPRFTDDFQTYELSEGDISNGYTQVPIYTSPSTATDLKAVIVKEIEGYIDLYKNQEKVSRSHVLKGLSELRNRINKKGESNV